MRINHMELWEGCSIVIRNDDNLWFKTNIYIYIPWRIHGAGIYADIWGIWMANVTIYSIHGSYGYIYIMIFFILTINGTFWHWKRHQKIDSLFFVQSLTCEPDLAQNFTCPFCEPWDVRLKRWCLPLHWRPSTFLIFFGTLANLAALRRGTFGNNSLKALSWMLSWMCNRW